MYFNIKYAIAPVMRQCSKLSGHYINNADCVLYQPMSCEKACRIFFVNYSGIGIKGIWMSAKCHFFDDSSK